MNLCTLLIYSWEFDATSIFLRYFIIAGIAYFVFYILNYKTFTTIKIQKPVPPSKRIIHDLLYSITTLALYCIVSLFIFYLNRSGYTKIYSNIHEFSYVYFFFSILIMVIIHDAWFYWTHRLMHLPRVFKIVHLTHHLSDNPTPWSAFAFHPLEAIISIGFILLIVLFIPVHPYALFLFLTYMTFINVMGHLGYETFPLKFRKSKIGKWQNTSTNHNLHHQNSKCNYGLYFTFWDRIMKTHNPG